MSKLEPHQAPFLGYVYWNLGQAYLGMGALREAKAWLEQGLHFAHATGFQTQVGHILNDLARVHLSLGDLVRAEATCRQALALATESGDKWLETSLLAAYGLTAAAAGRRDEARSRFLESLNVATSFQGYGFAMEALRGLADLWTSDGMTLDSIELLAFIQHSPLSPKPVAQAAEERLRSLGEQASDDQFHAALQRGKGLQPEQAFSRPAQPEAT